MRVPLAPAVLAVIAGAGARAAAVAGVLVAKGPAPARTSAPSTALRGAEPANSRCRRYASPTCHDGRKPGYKVDWGSLCKGPYSPNAPGSPWTGRSAVVASWVWEQPPSFLIDLGCGCLTLGELIPSSTRYIPSDSAARLQLSHHQHFPSIVDCDYNGGLVPRAPKGDMGGMVVAMGVIEYMCDPKAFVQALQSYELPILMSYAPLPPKMSLPPGAVSPRSNHLTGEEWDAILEELGFGKPYKQAQVFSGGMVNNLYWFLPNDAWGAPTRPASASSNFTNSGALTSNNTDPRSAAHLALLLRASAIQDAAAR